ncbi:SMP-30/gluconolactonase/LRE family protein [Rhizobium sullae]|uniref:IclR family transcriptional regulator n=1 Tax=Rhizobium sullae TaxID=50338 RepID=A0A2N0DEZ1_RHISU|nr:SMP-30/gluconolactonase/LRE family protein [Rhizobium sullae]PKA44662.1 IclR family transcriptional regulator [Rhizobium sullae]TCU20214.1 IclR family transcriptional regulator [Rhizobium sullae]UWU17829.1 SMP-30/gluconolactonase/LRE family protein [Rhizobium sullae]
MSKVQLSIDTAERDTVGGEGHGVPGVQALTRGIQIVEAVSAEPRGLRFTQLLDETQLPKGTLHRLLQALVDERLLAFDSRDQVYRLAPRLFQWAHKVWDNFDLRGAAEPELERLRDMTGEAIRLGVLDGSMVLYIDQREVPQPLRLNNGVGGRAAPHASGIGKAILAHLSLEKRRALLADIELERLTPNTIIDVEELQRQLDLTKARGYAVSVDEQNTGISSVAAPVLNHRGEPIGAIGIIGPSFRLPVDRLHAFGRDVIEAARRTSGNFGEFAMSLAVKPRPLGPDRSDVRCVIPASTFLGEGPHWSARENKLYFVDILAPAVYTGDTVKGTYTTMQVPELIGFVIPRKRGGFVAAMHGEIRGLDLTSGEITTLSRPEADRPGNRFNDGKCDRAGRLWAGTLAIDTSPDQGRLWRLDPDGRTHEMDRGFHVSNGLGWSPDDKTFYFTDTAKQTIYAYDFDLETGAIANRRIFVAVPEAEGKPDGLTVDAQGFVWSAHWDGWCVTRYDPDGKVERVINLPVPRPTSCVFGGPDMQTLFVTSARIRLSAAQLADAPLSGSVFAIDTGIRGLQDPMFGG